MSNRRFEMYEYRQVLVRMRQGDSDREIAKAGLMGRLKAAELRAVALEQGWLGKERPLPEDGAKARGADRGEAGPWTGLAGGAVSQLHCGLAAGGDYRHDHPPGAGTRSP